MNKLFLDTTFLVNNKIETIEDLLKFKKDNYENLNILKFKNEIDSNYVFKDKSKERN